MVLSWAVRGPYFRRTDDASRFGSRWSPALTPPTITSGYGCIGAVLGAWLAHRWCRLRRETTPADDSRAGDPDDPRELTFGCPHCDQRIECSSEWVGREIRCPSCLETLTLVAWLLGGPFAAALAHRSRKELENGAHLQGVASLASTAVFLSRVLTWMGVAVLGWTLWREFYR